MSKTDLIIALVKMRFTRVGLGLGLPEQEAALHAETVIAQQGLRGFFGPIKAMATPDGALAGMVETYVKYIAINFKPNTDIGTLSDQAIEQMERIRSRRWPGRRDYPRNIFDYIAYRTLLEFRQEFKRDPLDVGFDPETIIMMIKASLHFFMKQCGANIDPGIFVNLGKATMPPQPREQERAMVPFSPTLPDITKRNTERVFSGGLGSLTAFFCRNVPSIADAVSKGPSIISYPYVFAIFDTEMQRPVHFITLERSSLANTVALCEFRSDGMHAVLDIKGQKYLDEHQFLVAAYLYGGKAVSASFIELEAA